MSKITIVGAGSVGATIAYTLVVTGIASEIALIDVKEDKALGEAMDIRQGTPFCAPVSIYAGNYSDAVGSDVVVIACGVARKPGQSRLDLAQTNVDIIKLITPELVHYAPNAIYLIIANPVDILTYVFTKISGLPERQIIGSGTILDTARLRSRIAEYLDISQKNVYASVFGEHGDTSFVPWSLATIGGIGVDDYLATIDHNEDIGALPEFNREEIEQYTRTSGGKVISRKGATFYAVSIGACHIIKTIFDGRNSLLSVSSMLHGEYGIHDVCLSLPCIVTPRGIKTKLTPTLLESEQALLERSAESLREVISGLDLSMDSAKKLLSV